MGQGPADPGPRAAPEDPGLSLVVKEKRVLCCLIPVASRALPSLLWVPATPWALSSAALWLREGVRFQPTRR
jgi:hypothetical protein